MSELVDPPQSLRTSSTSEATSPFVPEIAASNDNQAPVDPGPTHQSINVGKSVEGGVDNAVYSSKYTMLSFLPKAIFEQFRRFSNLYFLGIALLVVISTFGAFRTSVSLTSATVPLMIIVSVSLIQEGLLDAKRHQRDKQSNDYPCVVLRRVDELDENDVRVEGINKGEDFNVKLVTSLSRSPRRTRSDNDTSYEPVKVAFVVTKRMDIRAGEIVLVRNHEMVPADIVLLGSSGERGSAYVETSQIDGETNLKLRTSPTIPLGSVVVSVASNLGSSLNYEHPALENIFAAVKRITRISHLGYPNGVSAVHNPQNVPAANTRRDSFIAPPRRLSMIGSLSMSVLSKAKMNEPQLSEGTEFVTTLNSELPNASVNTFEGKITLPPVTPGMPGVNIPVGAENFLIRGAALRNTEWAIGVAVFTGTDTKLIRNSTETRSKFSRLDLLINNLVLLIVFLLLVICIVLGAMYSAKHKEELIHLWYIGFKKIENNKSEPWPYLPDYIEHPDWDKPENFIQITLTYITVLAGFVPLSLYITAELALVCLMILISSDENMYHKETDTYAAARSAIVTDLGQVEYIFSDKTGTLTQNVMQFKRCSVNGQIFGAPIAKSAPTDTGDMIESGTGDMIESGTGDMIESDTGYNVESEHLGDQEFSSLGNLLKGPEILHEGANNASREQRLSDSIKRKAGQEPKLLTFNAEMFLRVMSICHTVVVEKDTDPAGIGMGTQKESVNSSPSRLGRFFGSPFGKKKSNDSAGEYSLQPINEFNESRDVSFAVPTISENENEPAMQFEFPSMSQGSLCSPRNDEDAKSSKSAKGAPSGYTYQAESPDEEALVSAASLEFGFQLKGRNSSGLTISCDHSSLLSNKHVALGLNRGTTTARKLASDTAIDQETNGDASFLTDLTDCTEFEPEDIYFNTPGEETWSILAVNKFDSTRKRMSVVVRSPPELGSIPMLLCKGADTSMLGPDVCDGAVDFEKNDMRETPENDDGSEFETSNMLGIHTQLGTFATEGLRTLVLGIRILKEGECKEWLTKYGAAAASLVDRESALTSLAADIEKHLHIVGCTAIEDKLQDGVPEAISNIRKAGIKLWVLTGDKRETATEIGYSSKVLHPTMNVTDIADGSPLKVRARVATEFMRLVKMGKLSRYQKAELDDKTKSVFGRMCHQISSCFRSSMRAWRLFYHKYIRNCCGSCNKSKYEKVCQQISEEEAAEEDPLYMRKKVRSLAEKVIAEYKTEERNSELATATSNLSTNSATKNGVLPVFHKAQSALRMSRMMSSFDAIDTKQFSNLLPAVDEELHNDTDEDVVSLESTAPGEGPSHFNKKKLTLMERLFATDYDVRHGTLNRHLTKEKKSEIFDGTSNVSHEDEAEDQVRALIIEGSALSHFLGDPVYEEMLFAMASCCKSIIACRVSPKQKALIVKMVQDSITPSPVSLAIGDGANDVGMIQMAHVGVGISGLEGQQAVNSSDFSIAQFRYLEELLLVHGRWAFIRLGKVVHFSFYKNAVQQAFVILFSFMSLYSGTPVVNIWVAAVFNFLTAIPILVVGIFDRDLDRAYVMKKPHVYASGPRNESFSRRISMRWFCIFLLHSIVIYAFCFFIQGGVGASMSSAFKGLMYNETSHGNGEGGGLLIYGSVLFLTLILTLSLKVLFISSSIINGVWPAFTCRKNVGEGFWSRVAYTWYANLWGSIILTFAFLLMFQYLHIIPQFVVYAGVTNHLLFMRSLTWMILIFVPISALVFDVVLKVFSNMYYPTQLQIHQEIQWKERQSK